MTGQTMKQMVLSANGWRCGYCGSIVSEDDVHIDHMIPKVKGGKSTFSNYMAACCKCNTSKGKKDVDEFRLLQMIRESKFSGVINPRQWIELMDRGVVIDLPIVVFHFENSQGGAS